MIKKFKELLEIAVVSISIMFLLIWAFKVNEDALKVLNQYNLEDVNLEVLYDVKVKMSEKYSIPIEKIRIIREEKPFLLGYEYLMIEVDEEDYEVDTYPIVESDIKNGLAERKNVVMLNDWAAIFLFLL